MSESFERWTDVLTLKENLTCIWHKSVTVLLAPQILFHPSKSSQQYVLQSSYTASDWRRRVSQPAALQWELRAPHSFADRGSSSQNANATVLLLSLRWAFPQSGRTFHNSSIMDFCSFKEIIEIHFVSPRSPVSNNVCCFCKYKASCLLWNDNPKAMRLPSCVLFLDYTERKQIQCRIGQFCRPKWWSEKKKKNDKQREDYCYKMDRSTVNTTNRLVTSNHAQRLNLTQ